MLLVALGTVPLFVQLRRLFQRHRHGGKHIFNNQAKRVGKLACQGASADCSASVLREQNNTQRVTEEIGQLARSIYTAEP